jgi:predicted dehydrogenase
MVHDHVWGLLGQFAKLKGVRIVAGADPNRPLREKLAKEYRVTRTYADWRAMFAQVPADAVLICASNAGSGPIAEAAAAKGLAALVEKPMAATASQARRMLAAAKRHKTRLMINWPTAWNAALTKAFAMIRRGDLGHVFHARVHMAHQGPKEAGCTPYFYGWLYDAKQNGGGAIIDYCCYGAAIFAHLWGRPRQVVGVARTLAKKKFRVDDNAMVTAIYPDRIALTQASWTQNPDYHDSLFLGTKGTLETAHGQLIHTHTNPKDYSHWGAERQNRRVVPLPALPASMRSGPAHFVHCLRTGKAFTPLCRPETGALAQEILSAGLASERTGRRIAL